MLIMHNDGLRAWRTRMDLTQPEAAELLGYSTRQFQDMEAGKYPIRNSVAVACAAISLGIVAYDGYTAGGRFELKTGKVLPQRKVANDKGK